MQPNAIFHRSITCNFVQMVMAELQSKSMSRNPHFCNCFTFFEFFLPSLFSGMSMSFAAANDDDDRFSLEGVDAVQDSTLENEEEYTTKRKPEHENLTKLDVDLLPLFVLDVVLPCQKLQLVIFEPHYRLMVRRLMEGNRRMGMVAIDSSTGSIHDYACEVEITYCEPLPDGRFYLEVESRRRCYIIQNWDQDGYRVAEVEWVQDISQPEGSTERNDLLEMAYNAAGFARQWMRDARDAAQGDHRRLAEIHKAEALMPPSQDPESFSFWLATLTRRGTSERLDILRLRDTKERIRQGLLYIMPM